jgi:Raf kinase inhibitor-like YbhB/YbcL family protein
MASAKNILIVSSPEFIENGSLPVQYTCQGSGINPPLVIDNIPEGTRSMALIVEDPDAPSGTMTHWVAYDILPTNSIDKNSQPGVSGLNTKGKMGWIPPCPPSGTHRYYFHVFALDSSLNLQPGVDRNTLENAMEGHILSRGTLMGRFGEEEAVKA